LVYPDFAQARATFEPPPGHQAGGIDWGWNVPFAAVWGTLDRDDVLWLHGERYLRQTALHEHAAALPRRLVWYADPAGATEIHSFRLAGHVVHRAFNEIRVGIQAVTARLRTGRLKVDPRRCPHLCAEAERYRYPSAAERTLLGETPLDMDNHALDALRYLVCGLDRAFVARLRDPRPAGESTPTRPWLRYDNEALWGPP
jgi:hypothetical protein